MVKKIDIAQKSPTEQATASGALVIFNGAGDQLLVDRVEASIREKFPSIDISDVRDALKSNYPSSVVIDITGKNSNLVSAVAQTIGGYVSDIVPVGETAPVSERKNVPSLRIYVAYSGCKDGFFDMSFR
jgi:hypothetical protein